MDKLDILFEMQKDLEKLMQERFGYAEKPTLEMLSGALIHEAVEFRDCLGWKWWSAKPENKEAAKEELADILHFVVSLALALGLSAEDLFAHYVTKNKINVLRQKEGY